MNISNSLEETKLLSINSDNSHITHTTRAHCKAGGSNANFWYNCTGYLPLKQTLPPQIPTSSMLGGTELHEVSELTLDAFLQKKITGKSNVEVKALVENYPDEFIATSALTYTETIWKEVLLGSITGKVYGIEDFFALSEKLDIGCIVDFWVTYIDNRAKRALHVVDLKGGFHEVPAEGNLQLLLAVLAIRKYFRDHGKDIDYALCSIYQPKSNTPYKVSKKLNNKQLDKIEQQMMERVAAAYDKPKYKVGSHCKWCQCTAICPAYIKSDRVHTNIKLLDHRIEQFPEPETVPDETIKNLVKITPELTRFLKAVKSYAVGRHIQGKPIAGLKVVEGTSRRRFDENELAVLTKLGQYIHVDELYTRKLKGIGVIESQLKGVGLTKKETQEILGTVTYKKSTSPVLVSDDDPRPAITNYDGMLDNQGEILEIEE